MLPALGALGSMFGGGGGGLPGMSSSSSATSGDASGGALHIGGIQTGGSSAAPFRRGRSPARSPSRSCSAWRS